MPVAKIRIFLKPNILDPQGKAIHHTIQSLGFSQVQDVRAGKFFVITYENISAAEAKRKTQDICEKILSNPIIESFEFQIENTN